MADWTAATGPLAWELCPPQQNIYTMTFYVSECRDRRMDGWMDTDLKGLTGQRTDTDRGGGD